MNVQILVLDFGSQYTQLIARRLREYGVYTEIVPYFESIESIRAKNPKGIILSGGPASVYEKDAYKPDSAIFTLGIPILGICYGMQFIAYHFGGKVIKADAQEFGKAVLEILESKPTINFELYTHQKSPQNLKILVDLWEDSVRASHLFLSKKDIREIRPEVKKAFQSSQKIIIAKNQDEFLGFIGIEKNQIEMLFVAPNAFKKGVGKALINEAFKKFLKDYSSIKVTCNEQNPQGLGFYQHLGFEIVGKNPKDSMGRNFPIVHLEVQADSFAKTLQDNHLNYHIEVAQKQDLEAILALQHTAFADEAKRIGKMDIEPLTQDLQSIEQDFKEQIFLKCTLENGEIVGSVRGFTQEDSTYLRKLFVNPKYRKKGIASALIHTLCAKLPTKRYELFTSEKSFENIALYEKLGFVRFKVEQPKGFPIKAVFLEKFADSKGLIETNRTFLRPYTQADFDALHLILSDEKTMYAWGHGFTRQESQEWLDKQVANYDKYGFGIWAIIDKKSGKIIGNAGLDCTTIYLDKNKQESQKIIEIGYILDHHFWGQGLANECAKACLEYAFETLKLDEVYCLVKEDNLASQKVAKKLGMHKVDEFIKQYQGRELNHLVFKLEKNAWNNQKESGIFVGVKQDSIVWMSHADKVESIPKGFVELAKSGNTHYCAIADFKRKIYALQFHPEVVHSECGGQMLYNFAVGICRSDTSWNMRNFAENEIVKLRAIVGGESPKTFITFKEACKEIGKKQAINGLLDIWEDSVKATQKMSKKLIADRREEIKKDYILQAEQIIIAKRGEKWLGFIAIKGNEITLLFVNPQYFRQKVGISLLKFAFVQYLKDYPQIMLNSREWAVGYYVKLGFAKIAEPFLAGDTGEIWLTPLRIEKEVLQKSLGLGVGEKLETKRCAWATDKDEKARKLYEDYHDNEWGVPLHDDNKLFELLVLEAMQAGLSWITILKKRETFRAAFDNFNPKIVANYDERKINELLQNEGIIRNRAKIEAAIANAKLFLEIQNEFGSFDSYIWGFVGGKPIINAFEKISDLPASTPLSDKIAKDLKKRGFKFVGTTIMYAYMQSAGIVNDHLTSCFKHSACSNFSASASEACMLSFLSFKQACAEIGQKQTTKKLLQIWEDGARATHQDLSEEQIMGMREEIKEHILESKDLLIAYKKNEWIGFIATEANEITMLFVAPQYFGCGYGKALIKEAYHHYLSSFDEVMLGSLESALGFYQHLGFERTNAKPIQAGMASAFSPELIPLSAKRERLQQSLGICLPKNGEVFLGDFGSFTKESMAFKARDEEGLKDSSNDCASVVEMRKRGFQIGGEGSLVSLNDQANNVESTLYRSNTPHKVLCAVSGGVDSSVVAALLYRAIGENLIPVFVDTGLLRKGEREAVEKMFRENLKVPLITADASELFLQRLKGVIDPEKKRKIIGETFIEVFEKEAKKHNQKGEIKFLAQGTLYPDVIESVSVKGPSKTIKSHHNVGGLPEWMQFELIEPLRELFKDEVRALGRELGMPETMLMRHPFPGPGLAIRIMGEVNKRDLDLLREADSIFIQELQNQGLYDKVWQAFCVLLNVRSVGVMGDNRTYDNTICVRAVEAIDGMTATFAHLPHDFLESVSNRIINEVEGINRVVYDITSKPPGTIEWE